MLTKTNKVNGLLGLATKAGKIACGLDATEESINKRKANLIIIAEDISENSANKIINVANKFNIKCVKFGTIESNSKAIGKNNKAVIAIKDKNFAEAILKIISGGDASENT